MKLPDFLEFEPFNELRAKIGTDKLGYFEVFDAQRHLTGEDRAELRTQGIWVTRSQLQYLGDRTLAYKNSRVALLYGDQLHVTRCARLDGFESGWVVSADSAAARTLARTSDGSESPAIGFPACQHCLHQLRFAGIDLDKERKLHHNKRIIEHFTLGHFFAEYPDYPLYERTHVRHSF